MTVLRASVGVPGMGFSQGQSALVCMARQGSLSGEPTFLQRVRRDLASNDVEVRRAINREITKVAWADTPALKSEEYGALAIVLRERWITDCVFCEDRIKDYTALVAHRRISAAECRKALPEATSLFSAARSEFLELFATMLREMSWEPAVVDQLIQTVRNGRIECYAELVPFLQVIHEKYPSVANGWASAALSLASRWGYKPGGTGFVGGKSFTHYLCTTTTPSDDGLLGIAWTRFDMVKLREAVCALPSTSRNVRPLSCDGWDDTVRVQALRRLLLCPESLTVTETIYICDHLDANDELNTFAAYLAVTPSLGPEQRCIVLARAARSVIESHWQENFDGLWTHASPTERMHVMRWLTPTQRGRFVAALLKYCGRSSRGEVLAESVRELFGAGIDGDALLSFVVDAAAMGFLHLSSCVADPLEVLEAYLLETEGVSTIRDFVGPFLGRYLEAPPGQLHGNHLEPQWRSALVRELRYRYNMALAKAWNVPPLRSALLLYAVNDPIRTALGECGTDVTGKHIVASLRAIHPIHLLANGEHGRPDLAKLEGIRLGIVGKLLAAGWQRGAIPHVEQLKTALKEETSGHRGLLPLVTTPTKQYPFHLLLNAHHRLAALVTLVADEIVPVSVLHAIPLRQPRLSTTALLREVFPAGNAVLLSWLDLLAFYPPAVKLLVRHDIG